MYLVLNNLQMLICHNTQPTNLCRRLIFLSVNAFKVERLDVLTYPLSPSFPRSSLFLFIRSLSFLFLHFHLFFLAFSFFLSFFSSLITFFLFLFFFPPLSSFSPFFILSSTFYSSSFPFNLFFYLLFLPFFFSCIPFNHFLIWMQIKLSQHFTTLCNLPAIPTFHVLLTVLIAGTFIYNIWVCRWSLVGFMGLLVFNHLLIVLTSQTNVL